MSNMAPDLSGLVPFMVAFVIVAILGAVVSLVIIGRELASFASAQRRARVSHRRWSAIA